MGGIYRGGYRTYAGEMLPCRSRFWVLAWNEVYRIKNNKWNRIIAYLSAIPFVAIVAGMVGKVMVEDKVGAIPFDFELLERLFTAQLQFMAILAATAGAAAVADDRNSNALALYLSRPLSPLGYLGGKLIALSLALALVYLLPAVLFVITEYLISTGAGVLELFRKLGQVLVVSVVHIFTVSAIVLSFSSFGRRARYAGLAWVALFFFSKGLAQAASVSTDRRALAQLLSLPDLFERSARFLLAPDMEPALPLIIVVAIMVVAAAVLLQRVYKLLRTVVTA